MSALTCPGSGNSRVHKVVFRLCRVFLALVKVWSALVRPSRRVGIGCKRPRAE